MRELENQKGLAERLSRIEERLGPVIATNSLTALSWMRWIPAVTLFLVVVTLLFAGARIVIVPLLASVALAYLLAPLTDWFERRGWSRMIAAVLTLTSVSLIFVLVLIFLVPGIWNQLLTSYDHARALVLDRGRVDQTLARIRTASPLISGYLDEIVAGFRNPARQEEFRSMFIGWMQSGLFGLVNLTTSILDLLLIPFFVFYSLSDYRQLRSGLEQMIPPRNQEVARDLIEQLSGVISTYVRKQMLISLVMGVLYVIGFTILRVPLGVTIGLLAGLLNFVPYLGTVTGFILALVFVALDGAGLWRVAGVVGVFGLVQAVEGYYLTPKLLGSSLNLHPVLVLLGLMVGGNLFGLLGIILAVPVIALGKVILHFVGKAYQESDFFRRSGSELLTGAGAPIELGNPAGNTSSGSVLVSEDMPTREPRIVITTGELRSRRPPISHGDD
ncbi:MAG: AI-2E family transporter [Acidobacteriota bacterium]